jgi:hypothetical protein
MGSETDTAPVGIFARNKFKGVVHRVLPKIGFIRPDDLEAVEKFYQDHGGKWRKAEKRELFFHESHVAGPEVRKGDAVEFALSVDPSGKFGERTVQAREITGGSGSKMEVKFVELEEGMLSDREELAQLKQKIQVMADKIGEVDQQAAKIEALESEQKALTDHLVDVIKQQTKDSARIENVESTFQQFQDTFGETVKGSLLEALGTYTQSYCEKKVDEAVRARLQKVEVEASVGENVEGSSEDEAAAAVEEKRKSKPSEGAKPRKGSKTYDFAPSTFQALKTSVGLSLLMVILVLSQMALFCSAPFQCEATLVVHGQGQAASTEEIMRHSEVVDNVGLIHGVNSAVGIGDRGAADVVFDREHVNISAALRENDSLRCDAFLGENLVDDGDYANDDDVWKDDVFLRSRCCFSSRRRCLFELDSGMTAAG